MHFLKPLVTTQKKPQKMSLTLVRMMMETPVAELILTCDIETKSSIFFNWLTSQSYIYVPTKSDISDQGMWCIPGDVLGSYYTLLQAIKTDNGWLFNDIAWFTFCKSLPPT